MSGRDLTVPVERGERDPLTCRVNVETQERFGTFVEEHLGNSRGAYGYAVEKAMEEYMDNDRYARIEEELDDLKAEVARTQALVRQLVTAEKEKGAFLDGSPGGNQAGSRRQREDAVLQELVERCVNGDHGDTYSEDEINGIIVDEAGVSSEPTKRDYRESLVERDLLGQHYGRYQLTEDAIEHAGYELQ